MRQGRGIADRQSHLLGNLPFSKGQYDALREVENGVVIRLRVVPGASKTALDGYDNWKKSLKFKTTEPAERGKANRSVLEFFENLTGRKTALSSGVKSRSKEILVLGATLKEVSDKLKYEHLKEKSK